MRSLTLAMTFLLSANLCHAQSLSIVSSDAKVFYEYPFNAYLYPASEYYSDLIQDDLEAYSNRGGGIFNPLDNDGNIWLHTEILSTVTENVDGSIELFAGSWRLFVDWGGPNGFYNVQMQDQQSAVTHATLEALSANLVDDVELNVTFLGSCYESGTTVVSTFFFCNSAGDEYFNGVAYDEGAWFDNFGTTPAEPTYSGGIGYNPDPTQSSPVHGIDTTFSLIVESGSQITVTAKAGYSNWSREISIEPLQWGSAGHYSTSTTIVELAP